MGGFYAQWKKPPPERAKPHNAVSQPVRSTLLTRELLGFRVLPDHLCTEPLTLMFFTTIITTTELHIEKAMRGLCWYILEARRLILVADH